MKKNIGMMMAGATVGLAVGAAAGMIGCGKKMNMRSMKRKAGKLIRAAGSIIDDLPGTLGL